MFIYSQLGNISAQISDQTLKLKVEIKFQNFFTHMMRINRYIDQRDALIIAYDTNTTGLIYYLDELISEYRKANLEYELVHYIDFEFVGSESLIDTFIQLAILLESNQMSSISSSTNKMINDFYMIILNAVSDGAAFLNLCFALREELTGGKNIFQR
jgi:hypothetical protein